MGHGRAGHWDALLERAGDGILMLALPDCAVLDCNRTAGALLGAGGRERLLGRRLDELVDAPLSHQLAELTADTPLVLTTTLRPLDGAARPTAVELTVTRASHEGEQLAVVLVHDATARALIDRERQRTQQMLQLVLDTIPVRVFWKDTELRFLGCNQHFARDAGLQTPSQLVGEDDFTMPWREQAELYRADDANVIASGEARLGYEEPQTSPSGERLWLRTSKIPLRDLDGEILGVLGTYEDITAHKRAEQERDELQAQLLHSQKMEAVGRLAGGVAHDFNNLLTGIAGYATLLEHGLPADHELLRYVRGIDETAERASALTQQLLAFGRRQRIEPRTIDLNEVIASARGMLERIIGEDVELLFRPAPAALIAHADPLQLEQVLVNLAVNSRDAMPRGGRLVVETAEVTLDEHYGRVHAELDPGRYVGLTVGDSGCGMDEATLRRVFEPFFTTKARGSGLGLATVYGIVKQHQGTVDMRSERGLGTTVKILLPAAAGAAQELPAAAEIDPLPRGDETILVVEDDPVVRDVARRFLELLGYTVLTAGDRASAESCLADDDARVDLLLSDVVLPRTSGPEIHAALLERCPGLRVLYMSGYAEDIIADQGVLTEGTALVHKPFTMRTLARWVRRLLDARPDDAAAAPS